MTDINSSKDAELNKLRAQLKAVKEEGSSIQMKTGIVLLMLIMLLALEAYLVYMGYKERNAKMVTKF